MTEVNRWTVMNEVYVGNLRATLSFDKVTNCYSLYVRHRVVPGGMETQIEGNHGGKVYRNLVDEGALRLPLLQIPKHLIEDFPDFFALLHRVFGERSKLGSSQAHSAISQGGSMHVGIKLRVLGAPKSFETKPCPPPRLPTQSDALEALAEILAYIGGQGVFEVGAAAVSDLEELPLVPSVE